MDREFLIYLIRSKKHLSLFLLIGGLLPTCFFLFYPYSSIPNTMITSFVLTAFIALVEALVLPFIYYSYLHSKRALDSYLSLPVSKTKILITNYVHLVGQIVLFAILGTVIPFLLSFGYFSIEAYIASMVILILLVLAISLMVIAIIYKTYSTIDSIVITLAYIVLPFLVYGVIAIFFYSNIFAIDVSPTFLSYFSILALLKPLVICIGNLDGSFVQSFDSFLLVEILIVILISIASIFHDNKTHKTEYAETISRNFFAYPLVIGLTTLCLCLMIGFLNTHLFIVLLLYLTIFVAYLIMNFIYRRKIQIIKKDLLLFATAIIASSLIIVVSDVTDGFGFSTSYRTVTRAEYVSLYVFYYDYSEDIQYDISAYAYVMDDADELEALIAYEDYLYEDFKDTSDVYDYDETSYWVILQYKSDDDFYNVYQYQDTDSIKALRELVEQFSSCSIYYYGGATDYMMIETTIDTFFEALGD